MVILVIRAYRNEHRGLVYCERGWDRIKYVYCMLVRHGGALVESKPFDRRVVGSNPALAAT